MEDIEEIYKKYAKLIKNYIFCITQDITLAEEIMQETFVVAITRNKQIQGRLRNFCMALFYCKKNSI